MKTLVSVIVAVMISLSVNAQYRQNGMPDMRYSANSQVYSNSYTAPVNSNVTYQSSYTRSDGTYVSGSYKTVSNNTNWDNFSTSGNRNPYTGSTGYVAPDYSVQAQNYGSGQTIYTGSRGGQYYYNSNNNRVYVPKR